MRRRLFLAGAGGLITLGAVGGAAKLASLPDAPPVIDPPVVPVQEQAAILAGLRPTKRARPVIAVVGINDATETTDYLMPYGVLKRSGAADVFALAPEDAPASLYPALKVRPDMTLARFDALYPDGADHVIVPAMSRDDDPAVLAWLGAQAARGAVVIGVCAGARVVAEAGLLDGRRGTTHWYYLKGLRTRHPRMTYVPDRRLVLDRGVATTTGITASLPMALTLIEAIAGRARAEATARDLGLADWDARHTSAMFRFNRPFALTVLGNRLSPWRRERLGLRLTPGMDEVTLALTADAWSRTYRSRAVSWTPDGAEVVTRSGLRLLPDEAATDWPADRRLKDLGAQPPARALDLTLQAIADRYGPRTADVVAMQLEYPRRFAS